MRISAIFLLILAAFGSCKKKEAPYDSPDHPDFYSNHYYSNDSTRRTKGLDPMSLAEYTSLPVFPIENLLLPSAAGTTGSLPSSYAINSLPFIIDQKNIPASAAFSTVFYVKSYNNMIAKSLASYIYDNPFNNDTTYLFNPLFVYNQLPVQSRRNLYEIFRFLKTNGVSNMKDMPFFHNRDTVQQPSAIAKSNALNNKIGEAYRLASYDVETFKKLLYYLETPIIIGLTIDNAFERRNRAGFTENTSGGVRQYVWNKYLQTSDPSADREYEMQRNLHALVIHGYDEDMKAFLVRNTWGFKGADNYEFGSPIWIGYEHLKEALYYANYGARPSDPYAFVITEPGFKSLKEGLVLHFPFNNSTQDESGTGNHGVKSANVVYGTDRKNRPGSYSMKFQGYRLPGTLSVTNSPSLQFSDAMSISFWVKVNDSAGLRYSGSVTSIDSTNMNLFAKAWGSEWGTNGYFNYSGFVSMVQFQGIYQNNYNRVNWTSMERGRITFNIGMLGPGAVWRHITQVYRTNGKSEYWTNGIAVSKENHNIDFSIPNMNNLVFSKDYPLNGEMDDIRVYNRALTATEIRMLYKEE